MGAADASARHDQAGRIFLEAAALPAPERDAFLTRACAGDDELRAAVQRLLDHDDPEAPEDARHRLGFPAASELLDPDRDPAPSESIDGFELLEVLGHGSMGVVYRARQLAPDREVALKLLHPSLLGSSAARRFAREAEYLSRLEHPGIARVFGAGVHQGETGERPYLVMELIHGLPLTAYAREARLDTFERIKLVRRVAAAVQHAHERGVVHRDLKPANVLVTESGQPKLVDFGAAGLVDASLQSRSLLTTTGQWIGTLAYMSPEQWDAGRHGVDERADVYALGVMLYELLAGRTPHELGTRSLPEALRVLAEEEPTPLSRIDRRLAGELETLVNTAIARDRRARYASAAEFDADLQRYLEGRPLHARPPSFTQMVERRIRRHPVFSVVVFLLLIGVSVFAGMQRAHNREITRELTHTRQVSDFVARFIKSKPDLQFASEETVLEMLERAEDFVTEAAVPPAVEGGFRVLVGNAYKVQSPERFGQAEHHIARGLEKLVEAHGARDRRSLDALLDLVTIQLERGRLAEAEASLDLLDLRLAGADDAAAVRVRALHRRGMLAELRGEQAGMRAAYERVAREGARLLPADDRAYREAVLTLAELELGSGGRARAAAYLTRCERELGAHNPVTLGTRLAWANTLRGFGMRGGDTPVLQETLALLEENARAMDASLGECAPRSLEAWIEVVSLHADLGALDTAVALMRDQFERCPSTPAKTRMSALRHWTLGNLLLNQLLTEEAHEELAQAHAHLPENPADDPRLHVIICSDLARALRILGRYAEGLELLRQGHALALRLEGEGGLFTRRAAHLLERYESLGPAPAEAGGG